MLFYYMRLYIEEIYSPHESVPRRALFQHSKKSLQAFLGTNFPATTDLNKLDILAKNTSNIMMHIVTLDTIQLQAKPHVRPYQSISKTDTNQDANCDPY